MASFFSTLFGGGAERDAADRNRASLGTYAGDSNRYFDTGLDRATGAVTGARDAAGGYLDQNNGLWSDYFNRGNAALDSGTSRAIAAARSGGEVYDPLLKKYGAGTDLYLDSLGVNGADGNTRAQSSFSAGPGYNFTRDQGLEALNRRRAAAGMLDSGNADIDALKFGTGLADQTYGSWQDRLAGFINPELSAAGGKAGSFQNIAGLIGQDTAARLGLDQNYTAGKTGINTQKASNDIALGNTLGNLYTTDASNRVGIAGNVLSGNTAASNMQAQGEASGARNVLGAGLSLANLAGGMGGGSGGGSSWFGSLTNPSRTSTFGFNPIGGAFSYGR